MSQTNQPPVTRVPQGRVATLPTTETVAPGGVSTIYGAWQVYLGETLDANIVACEPTPNGWKVKLDNGALVVQPPLTAPVSDQYQIRLRV